MNKKDEDEQAVRLAALLADASKRGDQAAVDKYTNLIRDMGYDK